jgi:hypothetical protein
VGILVGTDVFVRNGLEVGVDRSMPLASRVKAIAVGSTSEGIGSSGCASAVFEQLTINVLMINERVKKIGRKVVILIIGCQE